jgi:hypothetical protein
LDLDGDLGVNFITSGMVRLDKRLHGKAASVRDIGIYMAGKLGLDLG